MRYVKGRVLDIGCGAGRHSLFLQRRGFKVVGIDVSPLAVKTSRARGLGKVRVMSVNRLAFDPESFDTVLMLGSFGLVGDSEKAKRIMNRLDRISSPQALVLAESTDPYQTDDPVHLNYHESNRKKGRTGGQTRIRIRYRQYRGAWLDYLHVSKDELKLILRRTNWEVKRFIDSKGPIYVAVIGKRN